MKNKSLLMKNMKKKELGKYESALERYDDVAKEYNAYFSSFLTKDEVFCDRMDVLEMLEETVLEYGKVNSISISENKVSVNMEGLDLSKTAKLSQKIKEYDIVKAVSINEASYGGDYAVRLEITVAEEAGGTK